MPKPDFPKSVEKQINKRIKEIKKELKTLDKLKEDAQKNADGISADVKDLNDEQDELEDYLKGDE
jgi:F0F1-type ATP synthase membrane subunit b/b'